MRAPLSRFSPRVAGALALGVLWWLLGPWVLVVTALALVAVVVLGRRVAALAGVAGVLRPRRPLRALAITAVGSALVAGLVVVLPEGWLGIPPGAGRWVTPAYVGRPATPRPLPDLAVPQNPHLARNGASGALNDASASGSYTWPGPLGVRPEVETAWYGVRECAGLAVNSQSRLVGLCGAPGGPSLRIIDPESMRPLDALDLPGREDRDGVPAWEDPCGTALYLDASDRAVVATHDHRILTVRTTDAGEPALTVERAVELDAIPAEDCVVSVLPDWTGRTWFVTRLGLVGSLEPDTDRLRVHDLKTEIGNGLTIDEDGGVYVVTVQSLYRIVAAPSGQPVVDWRRPYDRGRERKDGQLAQGSGTGPALLPGGLVAIADNADPRLRVVFVDRASGEVRCRVPVFESGRSATETSLVVVGDRSVVVENNEGYGSPLSTVLGRAGGAGLARVDAGGCRVAWTADVTAPSATAKASVATGLVYTYTTRPTWWGVTAWYLTAIDARTGRVAYSVRTGLGILANSHYGAITITPGGSAYVATLGGLLRVRDDVG